MTTNRINIHRASEDSWTAHPQPPHPPTSIFIVDGWKHIAKLRADYDAIDHFATSEDLKAFIVQFGEPPTRDSQVS